MRKILKAALFPALVLMAALGVAQVGATTISIFTGPAGTNPAIRPDIIPDLNTLINSINTQLLNYLNFTFSGETGEMQISSTTAFAANGSVATSLGSVGPVTSHTTVQKWLIVIDGSGNAFFAPLF